MTTETTTALTTVEQQQLTHYEHIIARGVETFVEVGNALAAIRDGGLYRAKQATFEDYCRERWDIGRARAYQLISASAVVANVSTIVDTAPTNEAQARPLAGLPAAEQREAWKAAVETAPGGKPTAAHVQQVVEARKPQPAKPIPTTPTPARPPDQEIAAQPARPAPTPLTITPLNVTAPTPAAPDRKLLVSKRALLAATLELIDAELAATPGPTIVVRQDQAEQSARLFLANPALNGAAAMLAFSATIESEAA